MQPTDTPDPRTDDAPDAVDVVTGEVGSSRLREPADVERQEVDHDGFPEIETDQEPTKSA